MSKYKDTLNLPKTSYPIKSSAKREVELISKWHEDNLYTSITSERPNAPKFVLHDGPPYANGHLHHGHILNKVLKDIIVKSRRMLGYNVSFKPGWDCHGLPIELEVDKQLGSKRHEMSKNELRGAYREYASKFVGIQKEEFKRLGVMADWDNPYITMDYKYEAETLRQLAKFVEAGLVYNELKPVYWCPNMGTALSDTEIIHNEHVSPAVFVAFPFERFKFWEDTSKYCHIAIWTTTPWTLPGNKAVAVNPNADYILYPFQFGLGHEEPVVVSADRAKVIFTNYDESKVLARFKGQDIAGEDYKGFRGPSPILSADFVDPNSGTGCVHIAPAHGEDDFVLAKSKLLHTENRTNDSGKYYKHDINVVDKHGRMTNLPDFFKSVEGLKFEEANDKIISLLKDEYLLLPPNTITHKYPYSERTNKPVITRATKQWFIALDKPFNNGTTLRDRALWALHQVRWLPDWGYKRIEGMIKTRPDWCISRQRTWGVPIPAIKCNACGYYSIKSDYIKSVARFFAEEGEMDEWFDHADLPHMECDGCHEVGKMEIEMDILDVWFDSGVSNAAVMGGSTVDLYLEGSDQHRGWFQSTLLAALGAGNPIPYKSVLTHGFVVDDKGEKLSKSKKNFVDPFKYIEQNGSELLRLWVAQSDYTNDVKVSGEILEGVKQTSHRIRNTVRFLLSNLYDFSPKTHKPEKLLDVDQYILSKTAVVYNKCISYYENYDFHNVVKDIEYLCTNDISSFYAMVCKDRLYCDHADSDNRRSAQMTMFLMAGMLVRIMSPIMSFSMSDAWDAMPKMDHDPKTVFEANIKRSEKTANEFNSDKYNYLHKIRDMGLKKLEELRRDGKIGAAYDADARVYVNKNWFYKLDLLEVQHILGVSHLTLVVKEDSDPNVEVSPASGEQCQRCWYYSQLKPDSDLCNRCSEVL